MVRTASNRERTVTSVCLAGVTRACSSHRVLRGGGCPVPLSGLVEGRLTAARVKRQRPYPPPLGFGVRSSACPWPYHERIVVIGAKLRERDLAPASPPSQGGRIDWDYPIPEAAGPGFEPGSGRRQRPMIGRLHHPAKMPAIRIARGDRRAPGPSRTWPRYATDRGGSVPSERRHRTGLPASGPHAGRL